MEHIPTLPVLLFLMTFVFLLEYVPFSLPSCSPIFLFPPCFPLLFSISLIQSDPEELSKSCSESMDDLSSISPGVSKAQSSFNSEYAKLVVWAEIDTHLWTEWMILYVYTVQVNACNFPVKLLKEHHVHTCLSSIIFTTAHNIYLWVWLMKEEDDLTCKTQKLSWQHLKLPLY